MIDGLVGQGVISPDDRFLGMDMSFDMNAISPVSQSSNVSKFDDLFGGQSLFPEPSSFAPESLDQPATSKGKEPEKPTNMASVSTADMYQAISNLEQPKKTLPGTRHYGSDAAM
jgi:hypothetical protein